MKNLKELAQAHSGLKILISLVPKSLLAPLGKSVDISAPEFNCKRLRKGHLVVTKDQMTCRECSSPADQAPCLAKETGFPTRHHAQRPPSVWGPANNLACAEHRTHGDR